MKAKNTKSIETTNTLKGIAISAVLINHYLNLNISGDSTGFANAWIAIFFFLSGYGLYHSLNRHNLYKPREWFLFYYQRISRIFPLLWIAWFVELIVRRGNISFWIPTGIHASGHYWFISALLQCYVVSPVIYLAIKKRPIISLVTLLGILISVNYFLGNQAPALITKIAKFIHAKWRSIYFLYILIFAVGMLSPSIHYYNKKQEALIFNCIFWFLIFFITISMIFFKIYGQTNSIIRLAFNIVPLFMIILLCIYSLYFSIKYSVFEYLGRISYSIYLFHMSYYLLISKIGSFPNNSVKEFIACTIFFPMFIFICGYIEDLGSYINRKLRSLLIINAAQQYAPPDRYSAGAP